MFYAVSSHIEGLAHEHLHPIFLLDEAHLLHQDTLDHLHILLNYEWDPKPLLSLILVGLTDFEDRLKLRRNRSLYSRLARRLTIDPLRADDTADYLTMRLRRAGCNRDIFYSMPSPSCMRPPPAASAISSHRHCLLPKRGAQETQGRRPRHPRPRLEAPRR